MLPDGNGTGLGEDVRLALGPALKLAERLSAAERFAIEKAVDDAIAVCDQEEADTAILVEMIGELERENDDLRSDLGRS